MVQPGSALKSLHRKPGLLEKLAPHAVLEIDFAADDVIRVGRAAGEIDPAGVEGMRAHDTEKKGAIGAADRRGAETVAHLRVRVAPVLPGGKARVIGLEKFTAQHAVLDHLMMHQQHAAIP